jgi:hypothetical protein
VTLVSSQNEQRGYHGMWTQSGGGGKPSAKPAGKKQVRLASTKAPPGIPQAAFTAAIQIIEREQTVRSATGKPTAQQILYERVLAKAKEILRKQAADARKQATEARQSAAAGASAVYQGRQRQARELAPVRGKLNTRGVRSVATRGRQTGTQRQHLLERMAAEAVKRP